MPLVAPKEDRWSRAADGMVFRNGEPLLILDLAKLVPQPAAMLA
jgi:purine-binding chemotaxis protein CheW